MKVRCALCGTLIVRKKLVVIPGVYSNGKVMRVCAVCKVLPEPVHKKLFLEKYGKPKQ